jgi:hypothetical protein
MEACGGRHLSVDIPFPFREFTRESPLKPMIDVVVVEM